MVRQNNYDWEKLIEEAARSGLSVSEFCTQHNLSTNLFYRKAKSLGYMAEGKRTEKWEAAASGNPGPCNPMPAFVAVPLGLVEGSRSCTCSEQHGTPQPQIIIRYGGFQIALGDRFSDESLRRVLEVVAHA
jgi:hypothetical protein